MKRNYNYPEQTSGSEMARRIRTEHQGWKVKQAKLTPHELNVITARDVMGLTESKAGKPLTSWYYEVKDRVHKTVKVLISDGRGGCEEWNPCEDRAQAMMVQQHCVEQTGSILIRRTFKGWAVGCAGYEWAVGETDLIAMCRFAAKLFSQEGGK